MRSSRAISVRAGPGRQPNSSWTSRRICTSPAGSWPQRVTTRRTLGSMWASTSQMFSMRTCLRGTSARTGQTAPCRLPVTIAENTKTGRRSRRDPRFVRRARCEFAGLGTDRMLVEAPLADRHRESHPLRQDHAHRADLRRLVGRRDVAVSQQPRWRVHHEVLAHAAARERKHLLAVHLGRRAHAQLAEDAAVEVEQQVRMARVHRPVGEEVIEARRHHTQVVGHGLQLAVTALLAGRTEVIAFDEQQLHQHAPLGIELRRLALHLEPGASWQRAGRGVRAVHLDGAQLAAAVRPELGVIAEVRDVAPGRERGLQHRLPGRERHLLSIELEGGEGLGHHASPRWAPGSSRPVTPRARSSAPSRSNAGSTAGDSSRRSYAGRKRSRVSRSGRPADSPSPQWLALCSNCASSSMVLRSCCEPLPRLILSIRLRSSEVPTRHGVQKPQLSWAKKCAKWRAISNMSRLPSKTMNAPPVSMSSKAMRRPNSSWPMHLPDGPPTCTAMALRAPQSSSTCCTVTPNGYS